MKGFEFEDRRVFHVGIMLMLVLIMAVLVAAYGQGLRAAGWM